MSAEPLYRDTEDWEAMVEALSIAVETLGYNVSELADTGDYEAEDIAVMEAKQAAFIALRERLGGGA